MITSQHQARRGAGRAGQRGRGRGERFGAARFTRPPQRVPPRTDRKYAIRSDSFGCFNRSGLSVCLLNRSIALVQGVSGGAAGRIVSLALRFVYSGGARCLSFALLHLPEIAPRCLIHWWKTEVTTLPLETDGTHSYC